MKTEIISLAIGLATGKAVDYFELPLGFGWINVLVGFSALVVFSYLDQKYSIVTRCYSWLVWLRNRLVGRITE